MSDDLPPGMIPDEEVTLGTDRDDVICQDDPEKNTKRIVEKFGYCEDCGENRWQDRFRFEEPALGVDISILVRKCWNCGSYAYVAGRDDYEAALDIGMEQLFELGLDATINGNYTEPERDER